MMPGLFRGKAALQPNEAHLMMTALTGAPRAPNSLYLVSLLHVLRPAPDQQTSEEILQQEIEIKLNRKKREREKIGLENVETMQVAEKSLYYLE